MDAFDRILDLEREGLYCAQIMVQLALDAEGKENPFGGGLQRRRELVQFCERDAQFWPPVRIG